MNPPSTPFPPSPDAAWSAVVLAGGRSTRMGRDKAALEVGGQTLLALQAGRLREAGAAEILVSVAHGAAPGSGPGLPDGVRWIADDRDGIGPMAGILAALDAARWPGLLVLAVDLPAMDAAFLRELRGRASGGRGVVPRWAGRFEPLCAYYPREAARAAARELVAAGRNAARDLAARGVEEGWLAAWDVPPGLGPRLANWNRPGDWPAG